MHRTALPLLAIALIHLSCNPNKASEERPPSADRQPLAPLTVPEFDGKQAFDELVTQTKFGPRNPGSVGHQQCLAYLAAELRNAADAVNLQRFSHTGYGGERYDLTNIISSFNLGATDRIMLAAHWDTRPTADQEVDPKKKKQPILGANDGASGVAVLLEVARQLKLHPPPIGVDIILFDGEDFGEQDDLANFSLGARYFAQNKPSGFNPRFAIVVDMVGDKQLEILKDPASVKYAPDAVQRVWSIAKDLGIPQFSALQRSEDVFDDHIPLNEAGIRAIDIIDFDYPDESNRYWHTLEDTSDKCSPESLRAVGRVLMHLIFASPS